VISNLYLRNEKSHPQIYRPHHARENIGAALFEDDITISWQEKLFGPRLLVHDLI
jgi:hypothetical protein